MFNEIGSQEMMLVSGGGYGAPDSTGEAVALGVAISGACWGGILVAAGISTGGAGLLLVAGYAAIQAFDHN